ncbi:MAG: plasmid replication protein RepC [Octadecabacter sp.]
MKHAPQTQFGQPVEVCPKTCDDDGMADKWNVLRALTDCADMHDLTHRTLGVLKALMTFLPGRMISPEAGSAIVFPSNRTLGDRLNGMPESTLRRHLAKLVTQGAITRHDSPNRKRYARRGRFSVAFGLDLSPLARLANMLDQQAEAARTRHEDLLALRATVGARRHELLERDGPCELTERARQELRRKPCESKLEQLSIQLQDQIDAFDTEQMSDNDVQNERHIQYVKKIYSDSEGSTGYQNTALPSKDKTAEKDKSIDLTAVLSRCNAFQEYYPTPVRSWRDLIVIADKIAPMIGIDGPVWQQASRVMGYRNAATVVLCILENLGKINNPGGYLRRLTQTASAGAFDVAPILSAIVPRSKIVS